ncbi:hypothetical protein ACN4EK_25645 [Pantanalinema rosaneae CENA516]|uniref:hypothetical protein n=1 Tax=Pantanalinema rosaneae TaxID=1620701 RepID=UPI003D6FA6F2
MDAFSMDDLMAGKRKDPGYMQVSGYVPKELALRFKASCLIEEVEISEALEEMMRWWLTERKPNKSSHTEQ